MWTTKQRLATPRKGADGEHVVLMFDPPFLEPDLACQVGAGIRSPNARAVLREHRRVVAAVEASCFCGAEEPLHFLLAAGLLVELGLYLT